MTGDDTNLGHSRSDGALISGGSFRTLGVGQSIALALERSIWIHIIKFCKYRSINVNCESIVLQVTVFLEKASQVV